VRFRSIDSHTTKTALCGPAKRGLYFGCVRSRLAKERTMDDESISTILAEYDRQKDRYLEFAGRCESLVKELVKVEGHRVHSVTSRLKERHKLEEKLRREGKDYKHLGEITDIAGVRVITHFEDEVDKIGTLVEREFHIDRERSIDKRRLLDPDGFGYLSLHYICGLHAERLKLAENRRYAGAQCEVQIRSILQHAWAEIEHDLGYKPNTTVPSPIRRRFSRLAGLLEMGDQEFKSIREELESYAARVEHEIGVEPSQVEIDDLSIVAFCRTDKLCLELDMAMAKHGAASLYSPARGKLLAEELRYAGFTTVADLRRELEKEKEVILCQFTKRVRSTGSLAQGICLFHLAQVKLAKKGVNELAGFYKTFNMRTTGQTVQESAQRVVDLVRACR